MSFTESSHLDAKNRTPVIPADAGIQALDSPIKGVLTTGTSPEWQKRTVMTFGTFDIFHPWHVFYLSEAEKLAEKMIIVIARDNRVEKLKGKRPKDDEMTRQRNVAHAFRSAEVIIGDEDDIFAPLFTYTPDILAFGYDQRVPEEQITKLFPNIEIVRIGGYETDKWKSSLLRNTSIPMNGAI